MNRLLEFSKSECGAVTVDWTVMTAAVVGLGIASAAAVSSGTGSLGASIQAALTNAHVAGAALATLSFDDIDGLATTGWGWRAVGSYAGWTADGMQQNFEIIRSGYGGVISPDGGNMLDMDASPGNLGIGRVLDNMTPGGTHSVTFNAADVHGNNGVDVYFGGELVGSVDPGTSLESYSFDFVEGSGNGSNELVLQGTGPANNVGAYIHGIQVY